MAYTGENGALCRAHADCTSGFCSKYKCAKLRQWAPCTVGGRPKCPDGLYCTSALARCVNENGLDRDGYTCSEHHHCRPSDYCDSDSTCLARGGIYAECKHDAHCRDGLKCHNRKCTSVCTKDSECWLGARCSGHVCKKLPPATITQQRLRRPKRHSSSSSESSTSDTFHTPVITTPTSSAGKTTPPTPFNRPYITVRPHRDTSAQNAQKKQSETGQSFVVGFIIITLLVCALLCVALHYKRRRQKLHDRTIFIAPPEYTGAEDYMSKKQTLGSEPIIAHADMDDDVPPPAYEVAMSLGAATPTQTHSQRWSGS